MAFVKVNTRTYLVVGLFALIDIGVFSYGVARRTRTKDFTKVPLAQSEFLRDVAEPITIVGSIAWDGYEGSSPGITFMDARGVVRSACLADDQGIENLTVGNLDYERGRKVPIAGCEEQAFLGLLQRWSLQDPEARDLIERLARPSQPGEARQVFTGDETPEEMHKVQAVAILRKLLRRN